MIQCATLLCLAISLVATVIAWGAKFSEHPLFIADRHRNGDQSAFAKVLINRARDLAEDMKVHRIPNADHVVIALLIEPLQSRKLKRVAVIVSVLLTSRLSTQRAWKTMQVRDIVSGSDFVSILLGFHGFWLGSAIRLLLDLQVSAIQVSSEQHVSSRPLRRLTTNQSCPTFTTRRHEEL